MGSVKNQNSKKKSRKKQIRQEKLNKNLKHVAKILSRYKFVATEHGSKIEDRSCSSSSEDETNENCTTSFDLKHFIKIREHFFWNLQNFIKENWNQNSSVKLTSQEVENMSLQMEHKALLACMQPDVYKQVMNELITSVKEATEKKQLHSQIDRLVNKVWQCRQEPIIKIEQSNNVDFLSVNKNSKIPVIETYNNEQFKSSEVESTKSTLNGDTIERWKNPEHPESVPLHVTNITFAAADCARIGSPEVRDEKTHVIESLITPVPLIQSPVTVDVPMRTDLFRNPSPEPQTSNIEETVIKFPESFDFTEKKETVIEPNNVDDVTSTTNDNNFGDNIEQNEHDADIENVMRILEGTDENDFEVLIQNKIDLDSRVKQMERLFVGQPDPATLKNQNHKRSNDLTASNSKIWGVERYIFMYRILAKTTRMDARAYNRIRKTLVSLFGADSDEEHEDEFCDYEIFATNCVRRILPTVAKHLTPYYKERRICSGSFVFKNLVRRIGQSLVDQNYYPNDEEIKSFVDRFFPGNQRYMDVGDVWCFTLEY